MAHSPCHRILCLSNNMVEQYRMKTCILSHNFSDSPVNNIEPEGLNIKLPEKSQGGGGVKGVCSVAETPLAMGLVVC